MDAFGLGVDDIVAAAERVSAKKRQPATIVS
jgi:hypothetical protein